MTQDSMRRPDNRQGTFGHAYDEMMYIHERMAENGMQFALSLHQMYDDLIELAAVAERNRKGWKTNGLAAEQRVAEIEAQMRKSKAKYDSLAEEYDRARTGDVRQSGKMFGIKTKSSAHHEEDLLRKVQGADSEYHGRVQALQSEKSELIARTRPEAVKALQDLVRETDAGVTLQMQKFGMAPPAANSSLHNLTGLLTESTKPHLTRSFCLATASALARLKPLVATKLTTREASAILFHPLTTRRISPTTLLLIIANFHPRTPKSNMNAILYVCSPREILATRLTPILPFPHSPLPAYV
jgi:hypothetical protein